MVICHDNRHLELSLGRVGSLDIALLLSHPHSRLGNSVEVDVILTYELIYSGVLAAPVVLPLVSVMADGLQIGLCERDRSPKGLRPYPDGKTVNAVHNRRRYTPLDIACKAERNESLSGTVAYAVLGEYAAGFIAVGKLCELYCK